MLTHTLAGSAESPPTLWLHGFMGRGDDWLPLLSALPGARRHVIVDLPGHGGSLFDDPAAYTIDRAAAAVIAVLDAADVARCALVGYSMGGRLGLYLAVHYPARFTHLALLSASPGLATEAERTARRQWDERMARKVESAEFSTFLDDWYRAPLWDSLRRHADYAQVVARRAPNSPPHLALSLRGMGTGVQPSLWQDWATLTVPTLLIAGALDTKYVAVTHQMTTANPRAQTLIVPDAGHNVAAEAPAVVAGALAAFLSQENEG